MKYLVQQLGLPLIIVFLMIISIVLINGGQYQLVILILVISACLPLVKKYEQKTLNTKELALLAVLVSIAVLGRFLFFMVPAVTPMTSIIIIVGICLGAESGFLVGILSAVTSNILFGQGPWTPFQMFSWGIIGLVAGFPFVQKKLKHQPFLLAVYGIVAGLFFSFFMDLWTVFSLDHTFSWPRYATLLISAIPYTCTYCFSNVFFSLLLLPTMEKKLARILQKYGIKNN